MNALPTPQSQFESIQRLLAEKSSELDALRAENRELTAQRNSAQSKLDEYVARYGEIPNE